MNKEEFERQKKLLKLEEELDLKKHQYHLKELEVQKELEEFKFQRACELQRIKSAEIRKSQERKSDMEFMKDLGEKNE